MRSAGMVYDISMEIFLFRIDGDLNLTITLKMHRRFWNIVGRTKSGYSFCISYRRIFKNVNYDYGFLKKKLNDVTIVYFLFRIFFGYEFIFAFTY